MKRKRGAWLLAILLVLSGCGIVSLGYNYAEVYLRYTINSYASFTQAQKEVIHREVDDYMRWHRRQMLPEYVAFLQELRQVVQSGAVLHAPEVAGFRREARKLYEKTLQPTIKPAAQLLVGLTPLQLAEIREAMARENRRQYDREMSGSLDEQLQSRTGRTIDFIENLVGGLNDKQLDTIHALNAQLPYATGVYLHLKEDNQQRLLDMLAHHSKQEEVADYLALWLQMPEKFGTPEEQQILHGFEEGSDQLIADIYALLSERQKGKLLKSIVKYIETFQDLAQKT